MAPQHITVLGAGVTGLTSAVRLQESGFRVTIIARDFPSPSETLDGRASINYTSAWGGAHNRWVPPPPPPYSSPSDAAAAAVVAREHAFSLATYARMSALAASRPDAGVTFLRGLEYVEAPVPPTYAALDAARARELGLTRVSSWRKLDVGELPSGVSWGCEYRTWCVNPMVYCAFLLRRFVVGGGRVVRREVRGVEEAFAVMAAAGDEADVMVNASGVGFGDENVFITRGQTCLVANPCDATVTRQNADGTWTFCVPRGFDGGTVIGGTKEPDNWDPEPSPVVRQTLLDKFAATYPKILDSTKKFEVVRDIVGRRPTRRGGVRLEIEDIGKKEKRKQVVVHAYGLGGRGFELSWGVADEVARLVRKAVESSVPKL